MLAFKHDLKTVFLRSIYNQGPLNANGIRVSQLYNARGKKLAEAHVNAAGNEVVIAGVRSFNKRKSLTGGRAIDSKPPANASKIPSMKRSDNANGSSNSSLQQAYAEGNNRLNNGKQAGQASPTAPRRAQVTSPGQSRHLRSKTPSRQQFQNGNNNNNNSTYYYYSNN